MAPEPNVTPAAAMTGSESSTASMAGELSVSKRGTSVSTAIHAAAQTAASVLERLYGKLMAF